MEKSDIVFLFDVDNTLLDNDRVTQDLRRFLDKEVGLERSRSYWEIFERLRGELGYADYLGALQRYRMTHPYESHFLADSKHFFVSRRFGDPGYLQLSETAPRELQRGAESGSEIGAYSSLNNPVKLDSLKQKVDEFSPFGMIPLYIFET